MPSATLVRNLASADRPEAADATAANRRCVPHAMAARGQHHIGVIESKTQQEKERDVGGEIRCAESVGLPECSQQAAAYRLQLLAHNDRFGCVIQRDAGAHPVVRGPTATLAQPPTAAVSPAPAKSAPLPITAMPPTFGKKGRQGRGVKGCRGRAKGVRQHQGTHFVVADHR